MRFEISLKTFGFNASDMPAPLAREINGLTRRLEKPPLKNVLTANGGVRNLRQCA